MTRISFAQFFDECKSRLTDEQLRALNGDDMYFKSENTYFGASESEKNVWLSIVVGDLRGVREIARGVVQIGIKRVGFLCRPGSASHAIARYYKAQIKESGEKYGDGTRALVCVIDTQQTQRFNKVDGKKQESI